MSDISIALVQVAVLVALGHRTGHRLLLAVAALAGGAGSLWLRHPDPMSASWIDIATTTAGIVVGTAMGWWAIRAREQRLSTSARQRELRSTAVERARALVRRRRWTRALAALAVVGAAGAALHHFERERVHAGFAALQARLGALVAPAPAATSPATHGTAGASSGAASGSAPGRTAGSAAGAPAGKAAGSTAGSTVGKAAGSTAGSATGKAVGSTTGRAAGAPSGGPTPVAGRTDGDALPGALRTAGAERPRGDLRHCLELAAAADVLRCAER
jgi:hypothetical protein